MKFCLFWPGAVVGARTGRACDSWLLQAVRTAASQVCSTTSEASLNALRAIPPETADNAIAGIKPKFRSSDLNDIGFMSITRRALFAVCVAIAAACVLAQTKPASTRGQSRRLSSQSPRRFEIHH